MGVIHAVLTDSLVLSLALLIRARLNRRTRTADSSRRWTAATRESSAGARGLRRCGTTCSSSAANAGKSRVSTFSGFENACEPAVQRVSCSGSCVNCSTPQRTQHHAPCLAQACCAIRPPPEAAYVGLRRACRNSVQKHSSPAKQPSGSCVVCGSAAVQPECRVRRSGTPPDMCTASGWAACHPILTACLLDQCSLCTASAP